MIDKKALKEIDKGYGRMEEARRIRAAMIRLKIILISLFIIIVTIALLVKYI